MRICLFTLYPIMCSAWTWTKLNQKGPHVSGHAVGTLHDRVFLFSGLTGPAGSPVTDELWEFDGEWKILKAKNVGPGPRMYAAASVLGDAFYVFGGWNPGEKGSGGSFLDDSWKLDLNTLQWTELEKLPCGPVSRHSACSVNDDTIVLTTFRGVVVCKDDRLREQDTTGDVPDGLSMCTTIGMNDKVVLFGGSSKSQQLSSDVYVLDSSEWAWKLLQPKTDSPGPLASPCGALLSKDQCLVFGGAAMGAGGYEGGSGLVASKEAWLLNVEKSEWEHLPEGPPGRVAGSLTPDQRVARKSLNTYSDSRNDFQLAFSVSSNAFHKMLKLVLQPTSPSGIPEGSTLESLRLSSTGLSSVAGIGRAEKLSSFHAVDCGISGNIPEEVFNLENLVELYISFNSINGTLSPSIEKLGQLEQLILYGNNLSGTTPNELTQLPNLRELVLGKNKFWGSIPAEISSMENLEQVSFQDQQGRELIDGKLPDFAAAKNLWHIDFSANDLTGSIPATLLQGMKSLNASIMILLRENEFTGSTPTGLLRFDDLFIDLGGNRIDSISSSFCVKENWMYGAVGDVGNCDNTCHYTNL